MSEAAGLLSQLSLVDKPKSKPNVALSYSG